MADASPEDGISEVVSRSLDIWSEDTDDGSEARIVSGYRRRQSMKWLFLAVCAVLITATTGFALTIGDYPISVSDCYSIIWHHITGTLTEDMALYDSIIFELRLPRVLAGVLAGVALAVSGVVMQSTLMNPLADSYTTGVSSGAGLGATVAVVLGISVLDIGKYGLVANAFLFSLIPMVMIIAVSKLKNASPTTMIMAGIAVMYLFGAITTLLSLMTDPEKLGELYKWNVGSLGFVKADDIPVIAVFVLPITLVLMLLSKQLNILASGDDSAKSLGTNADMLRRVCLILVALLTASAVSFTGTIGFVGLVAPHIARIFIGADNRYLLPASGLFGAVLLLVSDLVGRTVIAPAILQVGVVMAFLGGPLFLWLILRRDGKVW